MFFFRLHYFLGVERDNENVERRAKATPIFRCNEDSVKICNSSIRCISGALTNLIDDVDGSIVYGCELIVIFAKGFDVNLKYSSLKFNGQTCDKSDTFNQQYSNLIFFEDFCFSCPYEMIRSNIQLYGLESEFESLRAAGVFD